MPKFLVKRWHGMHHLWAFVLMILLTVTLASYEWLLGLLGLLLSGAVGLYSVMAERAFRRDLKVYLGTLSYRVKKAGSEVISDLPFGIILYNEEKTVEWHNAFVTHMLEKESVVGESLNDLFPTLSQAKEREGTIEAAIGNSVLFGVRLWEIYNRRVIETASNKSGWSRITIGFSKMQKRNCGALRISLACPIPKAECRRAGNNAKAPHSFHD